MKHSLEEIQKLHSKSEASLNKTAELQQIIAKTEASLLRQEAQKMKEFYESKGVNLPNEWGIYRNPNPGLAEEIFGKYTGSNFKKEETMSATEYHLWTNLTMIN